MQFQYKKWSVEYSWLKVNRQLFVCNGAARLLQSLRLFQIFPWPTFYRNCLPLIAMAKVLVIDVESKLQKIVLRVTKRYAQLELLCYKSPKFSSSSQAGLNFHDEKKQIYCQPRNSQVSNFSAVFCSHLIFAITETGGPQHSECNGD